VINLDRSVDRLAHVQAGFARIGIPFERVAGVDASAGSPVVAPPLTPAEVCCFLSHRICWQMIADGDDRYGAIFEDDVVFAHDAGTMLADDGWVPRDADVVKFETYFVKVRLGRQNTALDNGYSLARLIGEHMGAAGYLISREAAQKLLKGTRRLKGAVDDALFKPTLMTCSRNTIYQVMPAICAQAQFLWEKDAPQTLIQFNVPERQKRLHDRISAEAVRTYGHLRNRSFFGTVKVDIVPFGRA
jgi:glycosyl transferase family 25